MRTGSVTPTNDALVMIDGLAFNTQIGSYLNLNTFDFSSISVFNNTGALNFLGGVNSGAFVLTSKTGEGVIRPTIEVNSYSTYGWEEINGFQEPRDSEWKLSNAIAFSQDFGAIDTRISYTNQKKTFQSYAEPYVHNLRLNTGLVTGDRFDLRLVGDGRFSIYDDFLPLRNSFSPSPASTDREKSANLFANGNLMARYRLTSWLVATSQFALTRYKSDYDRTGNTERTVDATNSRQQANFFLNASRSFWKSLNVSGFAGIQYVRQDVDEYRTANGPTGQAESRTTWEDENPAFVTRLSADYREIFILSAHYRIDKHSAVVRKEMEFRPDTNTDAYTFSGAFVFSKLTRIPFLSFGKVRSSFGAHSVFPFNNYPVFRVNILSFPAAKMAAFNVRSVETGIDLGLFDSRVLLTVNYFENQEEYDLARSIISLIDRYQVKGWETDIRFRTRQKSELAFESGVVFSRTLTGYYGQSSVVESTKPFMRLGWNGLASYRSVFASAVIESVDAVQGFSAVGGVFESTFTRLRDVSFGYRLPMGFARETIVSVSGRNLAKFGGSGRDWEGFSGSWLFRKSVSLNVSLTL